MAQRNFVDLSFPAHESAGLMPGDEHAHRAAAAMGDRFDAPTIIALTDALSFLDRMGGQLYAVTLRERVNLRGQMVSEGEPGEWRTIALRISYETRDGRISQAKPPKEILGVPVADFGASSTQIEVDRPEDSQPEPDPELEAEPSSVAEPALTE